MNLKKIPFNKILTILFLLFIGAYLYSARVKSWVIMAFLMLGFYKPHIPGAVKPGDKLDVAPAIAVQNLNGNTADLQQLKGKVVFVNFWAVWCPPCLAELPSINKLYLKFKDNPNVVFITIDTDNKLPRSSKMAVNRGYDFPVYAITRDAPPQQFALESIPTTLVINKQGYVVFKQRNRADYDDDKFAAYLSQLAKE